MDFNTNSSSEKMAKLLHEKKSARDFQNRKHIDWDENYELYRNKVKVNRLTQRQLVNIPLMKETIKTILSGADDAPIVDWKELSGDEMKEIIYQEIWDQNYRRENLETKDLQDKKNVLLYGISTKKLNLDKKGISIDVLDPYDVVYDPNTNPLEIESAKYIVHQNIFKRLRDILADERYEKKGKEELKVWVASERGLVQGGKNKEEYEKKLERIRAMGVTDERFGLFAGGDVLVNLTEHYTELWNPKTKKFERRVVVYADDTIELLDEKLEDLIGMDKWPFEFWTEDPETNDLYSDSVADTIRVPNKIINIWYSQYIENRSLANMGMHWYDATIDGYKPTTYQPGQGAMLPAPGNPKETIMPLEFNDLGATLDAIQFVISIAERASGATALEKGTPETGVQTLGEVEILVGKAQERAKTMSKYYKNSWYNLAKKWDEMMQNNSFTPFTLYKTGLDGKVYNKVVYTSDWKSKAGYEPTVASSSEQESDQLKNIQKFNFVIQQFPNNTALKKILQSRELKLLDLSPQELKEIQNEEERLMQIAIDQSLNIAPKEDLGAPAQVAQTQPVNPTVNPSEDTSSELDELKQLIGV